MIPLLDIPFFYLKDKQAFRHDAGAGSYRIIGNPSQICRDLAGGGAKLIHIIDLDAKKGIRSNMDIYDKLTYFVNIEVECDAKEEMLDKLFGLKARAVVQLPSKANLSEWKANERLLVGIVGAGYDGNAEGVHDVIIENVENTGGAGAETLERLAKLGKRIIVHASDYENIDAKYKKWVWGVLRAI